MTCRCRAPHCQFEVEGDGCFVRDLNSRNGTLVLGQTIDRAALKAGDHVMIGKTTITLLGTFESAGLTTAAASGTKRWTARLFTKGDQGKGQTKQENHDQEIRRLRRLLELNGRIAAEIEPERVLTAILDSAVEFVDAERGFLMTVDEDRLFIPVARDFWRKDIEAPAFEVSRSIALEVIRRKRSVITEDASEDQRFDEMVSVMNLKIRSVLCVPLINQERVIGAIYLDNRFTRGSFHEGDMRTIDAFADQAAISLINSGIVEKKNGKFLSPGSRRPKKASSSLKRFVRK